MSFILLTLQIACYSAGDVSNFPQQPFMSSCRLSQGNGNSTMSVTEEKKILFLCHHILYTDLGNLDWSTGYVGGVRTPECRLLPVVIIIETIYWMPSAFQTQNLSLPDSKLLSFNCCTTLTTVFKYFSFLKLYETSLWSYFPSNYYHFSCFSFLDLSLRSRLYILL